jgi:hypothetical protein
VAGLPAILSGVFAAWGEEVELYFDSRTKEHSLALPLADALADGVAGQSFKLELTAFEGQTQIDSDSLEVQVLSDPHEQQNPLPNREFLAALAESTGGRELPDAASLLAVLNSIPIAEEHETVHRTPVWSRRWLLGVLIALLSVEWFFRRWLGLA